MADSGRKPEVCTPTLPKSCPQTFLAGFIQPRGNTDMRGFPILDCFIENTLPLSGLWQSIRGRGWKASGQATVYSGWGLDQTPGGAMIPKATATTNGSKQPGTRVPDSRMLFEELSKHCNFNLSMPVCHRKQPSCSWLLTLKKILV